MSDTTDRVVPSERWEFDEEVSRVFDDMLARSIPQYQLMRETVFSIGRRFARAHLTAGDAGGLAVRPAVLDVGCSRGGALAPFVSDGWEAYGLEVSPPMVSAAQERFAGVPNVAILEGDLRRGIPWDRSVFDVVLSVLTLQFVPINYRQQLVQQAHACLHPGGALILVEKVLGEGARIDDVLVDVYHESKALAGYDQEAIERKRLSLEGVLVPVTAGMNEQLLRGAGFRQVDCFWRWCNFSGWIAVR